MRLCIHGNNPKTCAVRAHAGECVARQLHPKPYILEELRIANLRRVPDFGKGNGLHDWSLAERANELQGEAGELGNVLKKLRRTGRHTEPDPALMAHALEELADVYICADLIAAQAGWTPEQVEQAIRDKFNSTSRKIGSAVRL